MAKRILIAGFRHETNTFSKLPTDMAAFEARGLHAARAPGGGVALSPRHRKPDLCPWAPTPMIPNCRI